MRNDVQFFYNHAGYSYGPNETPEQGRLSSARALASAERWAQRTDKQFVWGADVHDTGDDPVPETCEFCTILDEDGEHLASVGCIDDADDNYRRVIQAEIAYEARCESYSAGGWRY